MPVDRARPPAPPGTSPSFVVVTGCNGVGKTTVARALRDRLGAEVLRYPPAFLRFREEAALDAGVAPLARLLYYLGATAHLSDRVQEALTHGPVVCDRYLESPLSLLLAEAAFSDADLDRLCTPFLPHLRAPDVTVLLTADYATACRRIRERARAHATRSERLVLGSPAFYRKREAALRAQAARLGPVVELDTTDLSLQAVCDWACSRVVAPS